MSTHTMQSHILFLFFPVCSIGSESIHRFVAEQQRRHADVAVRDDVNTFEQDDFDFDSLVFFHDAFPFLS